MAHLLDTNVVSELRRLRPHSGVLAWSKAHAAAGLHICAVTLGEIQSGVERVRPANPAKAAEIEAWLNQLAANASILPLDGDCFRQAAKLMHRTQAKLVEDALIAATGMVHGLTIATRNTKHFALFGVPIVNPFEHS